MKTKARRKVPSFYLEGGRNLVNKLELRGMGRKSWFGVSFFSFYFLLLLRFSVHFGCQLEEKVGRIGNKYCGSLDWRKSSFSLFISYLLSGMCWCDELGLLPCWWGWRKGKVYERGVEAFCLLIYRKKRKWSFFIYIPRQELFKAFLENRWPSLPDDSKQKGKEQERFAYISDLSSQLWMLKAKNFIDGTEGAKIRHLKYIKRKRKTQQNRIEVLRHIAPRKKMCSRWKAAL